jgi:hypothetical protein
MSPIGCPQCGWELPPRMFESTDFAPCQICGAELSLLPFRAAFAPKQELRSADMARSEEEAPCFYHESKKAAQSCSRCGRFLCSLCAAEFGSEVLCPDCLVAAARSGQDARLETERTLYDSIAFALAVVPAFTVSFTIFGAPAAIYTALRFRKRPTSLVRRRRWRIWAALLIGLAEVGFWVFAIAVAVTNRQQT